MIEVWATLLGNCAGMCGYDAEIHVLRFYPEGYRRLGMRAGSLDRRIDGWKRLAGSCAYDCQTRHAAGILWGGSLSPPGGFPVPRVEVCWLVLCSGCISIAGIQV